MRQLFQGDPNDLRFQFKVIENLAESVRQQGEIMKGVQDEMRTANERQFAVMERLTKLEANRVNEDVFALKSKVDALEQDRDIRAGTSKAWRSFLTWWGPITTVIGVLFTVFFLLFRATGVLQLPENKPAASAPIERVEPKGTKP